MPDEFYHTFVKLSRDFCNIPVLPDKNIMILESETNLHDREGVFGENDVLHHVDHPVRCHLGEQDGHNVHVNADLKLVPCL